MQGTRGGPGQQPWLPRLIMGMAGPSDQEAAQHAAVSGTDASLRQRQGN